MKNMQNHLKRSKKWGFIMEIKKSSIKKCIESCAKKKKIELQKGRNITKGVSFYCILKIHGKNKYDKFQIFNEFLDEICKKNI